MLVNINCRTCDVIKTVMCLIFTAVITAAILGMIEASGFLTTPTLGSSEASLSVLALVIALMLWTKNMDCSGCPNPKFQQCVVFVFLILATIATLVGLYKAHVIDNKLVFGTMDGSLSILAFAVAATYWTKHVESICSSCKIK